MDDIVDRIFAQLQKDIFDKGQTISEIASATNLNIDIVEVVVKDDSDIVWTGQRNGEDLYISGLHLDREGTF